MKNIKVALVDDHTLFVKGMAAIIKRFEGIELVMEAKNGEELLHKLQRRKPNVILMDIKMPEMDGISATRYVVENYPNIKIIALTMHDEEMFVNSMLETGAHGYLLKNADTEEVEKSIRAVVKNDFFIGSSLSTRMVTDSFGKVKSKDVNVLKANFSERELKILELICKENNSKEIGEKLFIGNRTVERHREDLLYKTGAKNTAGLVVYALQNGLVVMGSST